jgi:hypothetical protein
MQHLSWSDRVPSSSPSSAEFRGAIQDVLQAGGALGAAEDARCKTTLDRIVAMRTKLGQRGYTFHEESDAYGVSRNDTDSDPDSDRSRK